MTDDLEKDHILHQRILLFSWVKEEHLDISMGEGSQGFIGFAQKELLNINHYKAPRDKLICILNCCKVIFGLLRHFKIEENADAFLPILIFVVLKTNPDNLISNIEYINRFRNPEKLRSEAGYYLSSVMGAVSFIETMDHSSLSNISQEEFEHNVELTIRRISTPSPREEMPDSTLYIDENAQPVKFQSLVDNSFAEDTKRFLHRTGETIGKPMMLIGKIFADALDGFDESGPLHATSTGYKSTPIPHQPPIEDPLGTRSSSPTGARTPASLLSTHLAPSALPARTPSMDFSALQLEIDRAHETATRAARDTLKSIFPTVEDSVADMILEASNGDVGQAIDQLLEMIS